jgi:Domain of unknown function (DUF4190)
MNGTFPPPSGAPKLSGLAVTSLVLGILGLVLLLCAGPVLFAIPAIICGHIAYSRIKNSGGQLRGQGTAIGGFVTGYVGLGLMVLLLPVAIPNFVKARQTSMKNMCKVNLRIIDAAKQQWVQEHPDKKDSVPSPTELDQYLKNPGGFSSLKCPAGGTYDIKAATAAPTCSIPEHQL